jgi:hypothetical protein
MIKTRLVNAFLTAAIIAGLVVIFWFILPQLSRLAPSRATGPTPVILQQVQTLSQLVTVKYVMEKVVTHDDGSIWNNLPLGQNNVILIAHGIVKAGIDLGELHEGDITISSNKIFVRLPPARITDTYLDDKLTQVVDYNKGLLRSFDKNLEQDARRQAVMDINRAAREAGILKDADERARQELTSLFHQMGYEEVEFRGP